MNIRVQGNPHMPISRMKKALRFYAETLMGKQLPRELRLLVTVSPKVGNQHAYVHVMEHHTKPRKFKICIDELMSERNTLIALAHEMVHVKQYALGELAENTKMRLTRWHEKFYNEQMIDYLDQPWEIEAFGRERGLYVRFVDWEHGKTL